MNLFDHREGGELKDKYKKHLTETARYIFFGPFHFAAGWIKNPVKAGLPKVYTVYMEMEKPSEGLHRIFLMPQEAQAVVASLSDALFRLEAHKGWKKFRRKNKKI